VDDILAQADTTGVRADGYTKLGGHEQDGEDFGYAGKTARVDLDDVDRLGLQQLLEHDAVVRVLAGCNTDPVRL